MELENQNITTTKKKTVDKSSNYIKDPISKEQVFVGNSQYDENVLEKYHIKWVSPNNVGKNLAKGYAYCEDKKYENIFSTYKRKVLNEIDPSTQKPKQQIPLFIDIETFNRMQDLEHRPVNNKGLPEQVDDVNKYVSQRTVVELK